MDTTISLSRDSGYADHFRTYRVLIDGAEAGLFKDGQTVRFNATPGQHQLMLKIDWCGSNVTNFHMEQGQPATFICGSSLRRARIFLGLYYIIFARNKYLWLKVAA